MITDLVMPHMGGRDLVERLTSVRPKMKILFMSGYTDRAVVHRELTPGTAFVQKPFTPETLARKVRTVLDQQPVSG
jgi:two-component SAPR family response regulator